MQCFVDRLRASADSLSTCFIEPNGRNSPVQPSFGVTLFVYVSCLFGVDEKK